MFAFDLFALLPVILLLSLAPALAFGRNPGDLFLVGQITVRASQPPKADLESLNGLILDVGFQPISRHPLIGKHGVFPYGERVQTLKIYELSDRSTLYLNRRLGGGVWLLAMMANPRSRLASEASDMTKRLSEVIPASFGLISVEISDDLGIARQRG